MIAFGPVPSRRLGQSLGINNIPPKTCSYNCIYCQVGPTPHLETRRRKFYEPEAVLQSVRERVEQARATGARIDYLTFVPDGEPTLDINLGRAIELLRPLGIRIAVISNSSLLWQEDVREELALADCVSLKVDSVAEKTWRKINRPDPHLDLPAILEGALAFSREYEGELITETMLLKGLNDDQEELETTAAFLGRLRPATAYLAAPTRPPSEEWVAPPDESAFNEAFLAFSAHLPRVEFLLGFSEEAFSVAGDVTRSLLDITAVHPMRESEVLEFLEKGGAGEAELKKLLSQEKLVKAVHEGQAFYVRKLSLK